MDNVYTTAFKIVRKISDAGFIALFAGGAVRDQLLGRTPKDYDIATDALPDQIEALFPKTVAVGKAFGVIMVVEGGLEIEVATFRKDEGYQDGRRPDSVHFCGAEEDAKRRDFTINGMFCDPLTDQVIDYIGGRKDLHKKLIRAIGEPDRRFAEDHLRMLRAVRFAHTLGFTIDPSTRDAIKAHAQDLAKISAERIENEFSRILTESIRPGDALRELVDLGLMEHIIPEILPMIGQEQPPQFHPEGDVFEHTVLMLNLMKNPTRPLAYSVLLHDVGKPDTAFMGEDRIRFHGHEIKSANMAEEILRRLRLPIKEIKQIVITIAGHMRFKDVQMMNKSTLRKLMGAETFDMELELHRVDCEGSHRMLDNYHFLLKKAEEMDHEPVLPERWISGKDLCRIGVKPGPRIGELLQQAYDAQLEGRFSSRSELLNWLKKEL
ncbi:CCA tRNA nucleotidyltransferase [Tichowtungia aerotolerans]|uniref:HD domain-containing protein n=1 Tax=Tichowtungia aerotolerans TaxID=2697043 RepID=A0A6P1MBT4_9BACT|nr:HD domain-containing protein [Tichowtungia aerotolerans]QHI70563.1 HD domain-containing protein [Tichowtungia aerotolerans]